MARILLVDDDPDLRASLVRGLGARGYDVTACGSTEEARRTLGGSPPFALVLLDVTMPGEDGWALLEGLRSAGDETPVIFLTARQQLEDRIRGLRLGADDYVMKPFELDELSARIEANVRRFRPDEVFDVSGMTVNLDAETVEADGRQVELSQREFGVLAALIRANGDVVSRQELLHAVWDMSFDPGTNVVDVVVMRLRRKLDLGGRHTVQTTVGKGYSVRATRVTR